MDSFRNVAVHLSAVMFFLSFHVATADYTTFKNDSHVVCVEHKNGISLVSFRWNELGVYFTITSFIVIAGLAKLGFHKLKCISSKVPESCLLILLGLVVGLITHFALDPNTPSDPCIPKFEFPKFTSEIFFFVLLPPIILDSAYSLHDRVFMDNLGTVLVFAVIGTLFNVFAIGGTLFGAYSFGLIPNMKLTLSDAFVFSSLICAVDPVAVLAIFQELGVNQNLYFLIFGESLLNDGVTVVLYNTMQAFRRMEVVEIGQVMLAILSFFIVSIGGILIGLIYGLFTSFITKYTECVRVVEPLAVLALAYLSYVSAELFHFSGIISLIVCGIVQAHFGFYNISQKSYICVKYFTKMASATCDTVIFMFLGMVLVNDSHQWNTAFVIWSIFLCLLFRFISVFFLSALANLNRTRRIDLEEQFIAAYGGLRGAVAFSLATTLDDDMDERNTYIFTTLMVILFTVYVQGITIKPLVHLLNIQKRRGDKKKLSEEIAETSMDHVMAGVEEILGHHGDFYLRELIMHYNEKYLKRIFLADAGDTKLTRLFEKICLAEHYAHLYGPAAMVESDTKPKVEYSVPKDALIYRPVSSVVQEVMQKSNPEAEFDTIAVKTSITNNQERSQSTRRRSIRNLLNSRSTIGQDPSPTTLAVQNDEHVLRKALRDNRYNKLHYTYNPNLVNEEDQELSEHLNRRTMNARRMSFIASAKFRSGTEESLPGHVPDSASVLSFGDVAKSVMMMQRPKGKSLLYDRLSGLGLGLLLQQDITEESTNDITEESANDITEEPTNDIPEKPSNTIPIPKDNQSSASQVSQTNPEIENIPLLQMKKSQDEK